jgi:hypothetical protein
MRRKRSRGEVSSKSGMKLQIALVGAGNLASALSEALRSAGHGISEIIASDRRGSFQGREQKSRLKWFGFVFRMGKFQKPRLL